MFSFDPRCQGLCGIRKEVDLDAGVDLHVHVARQVSFASVPGERLGRKDRPGMVLMAFSIAVCTAVASWLSGRSSSILRRQPATCQPTRGPTANRFIEPQIRVSLHVPGTAGRPLRPGAPGEGHHVGELSLGRGRSFLLRRTWPERRQRASSRRSSPLHEQ